MNLDPADEALERSAEYAEVGIYDQAREILEEALVTDPGNVELLSRLGFYALADQDPTAALAYADRLADLDADDAAALHLRSSAYQQQGKLDKALAVTEYALSLHPGDPDFLSEKAWALYQQDRLPEALAVIEDCLAAGLQPVWNSLYLHAHLVARLRSPGEGLAAAEELIGHFPHEPTAQLVHGQALAAVGRSKEASDEFRRVLQQEPGHPEADRSLTELIMKRNPVYRGLAKLDRWLKRAGVQNGFYFWILVMIVSRIVRSVLKQFNAPTWVMALIVVPIALIALGSWYMPGLMLFTLWLDPYGRRTILPKARALAFVTPLALLTALGMIIVGLAWEGQAWLLFGGFALALAAIPVFHTWLAMPGAGVWRIALAVLSGGGWVAGMVLHAIPGIDVMLSGYAFGAAALASLLFMWTQAFINRKGI